VLGEEHVNRSINNADDFTRPLQQFLVENAWGAVWTREGLTLKERSMLNLAMLTALNRPHELKLHLRGAINNGLTKEQIREIFLQTVCVLWCTSGDRLVSKCSVKFLQRSKQSRRSRREKFTKSR